MAKDSVQSLLPYTYDTLVRVVLEDLPLDSLQQEYDIQPIKKSESDSLPFYILLFIVGIFGYVRFNFFTYLYSVKQSFFNINLTQQFFEEHAYSVSPASFFLNLNTILIYTVLVFLSLRYFGKIKNIGDIGLASIILATVLLVSLSRYWSYRIAANILPIKKTLLFYLFNIRILNYVMGAALVPLLLILAFADNIYLQGTIWLIVLVISSFTIYRCYRGFLIGEQVMRLSKFHFFVYLCTFEIAPILILYKVVGLLLV
ncbi:MAG: DUF4271 domain-containing protein [Chitinophagales bacterium]